MDVDEEQDVVAAQGCRVVGEEVTRHGGLGAQELAPRDRGAFGGGVDVVVFEDLPHRRRRDGVAEADEFALDASMPPGRVVLGESHDQSADLGTRWRSSRVSAALGPVAGDSSTVPSQQRLGSHDPALAESAGEYSGNSAEQGPVVVTDGWPSDLAAKHLDLVAQHDDL